MLQFTLTLMKNIRSGRHAGRMVTQMCNQDIHAPVSDSRASLEGLSFCLMIIVLLGETGLVGGLTEPKDLLERL